MEYQDTEGHRYHHSNHLCLAAWAIGGGLKGSPTKETETLSLIYDFNFQIGSILLISALLITIFSKDFKIPFLVSILQGLGLGCVCVPIFEGSRIHAVIIFLLWMIPVRIDYHSQKSSGSEKQ